MGLVEKHFIEENNIKGWFDWLRWMSITALLFAIAERTEGIYIAGILWVLASFSAYLIFTFMVHRLSFFIGERLKDRVFGLKDKPAILKWVVVVPVAAVVMTVTTYVFFFVIFGLIKEFSKT